jgi:hypothetical protein
MASPHKLAHVVYNTHRCEEMIGWYLRVLEARVQHRDDRLAFLPFDPDELAARFEAGAPVEELVFRSDQTAAPLAR